jgi:hypothetical protein
LQIGYGSGRHFPQYAVLDLRHGFLRMVYSRTAGWGTSVVLLPALWSKTSCPTNYCQGAPVTATWRRSGASLKISVHGTIATLKVASVVTISPPARAALVARVFTKVSGTVVLDGNHPGEAFKPVMLSSMHISATTWDSRSAFIGAASYPLPASGWIIQPPVVTTDFGLQGGTSAWKRNAPTVEVILGRSLPVTGWVTASNPPSPKDNNVAFWCATTRVLSSWRFSVTAEAGQKQ